MQELIAISILYFPTISVYIIRDYSYLNVSNGYEALVIYWGPTGVYTEF